MSTFPSPSCFISPSLREQPPFHADIRTAWKNIIIVKCCTWSRWHNSFMAINITRHRLPPSTQARTTFATSTGMHDHRRHCGSLMCHGGVKKQRESFGWISWIYRIVSGFAASIFKYTNGWNEREKEASSWLLAEGFPLFFTWKLWLTRCLNLCYTFHMSALPNHKWLGHTCTDRYILCTHTPTHTHTHTHSATSASLEGGRWLMSVRGPYLKSTQAKWSAPRVQSTCVKYVARIFINFLQEVEEEVVELCLMEWCDPQRDVFFFNVWIN